MEVDYVEAASQEFFDALPEVPDNHLFNKGRDAYLRKMLPTKEEWEAKGGNGIEEY